MPKGGTIDFYCRHAYAHATQDHNVRLPHALKGVDAVFYSIFHVLGFKAVVRPVMSGLRHDNYEDGGDPQAKLVGQEFYEIEVSGDFDEVVSTLQVRKITYSL